MKHFWSDVEAQDAGCSDRRDQPVGGDLGEFPCGKRWASLRGNAELNDARCATLTAAAGFNNASLALKLGGRISSGAAPPRPATEQAASVKRRASRALCRASFANVALAFAVRK